MSEHTISELAALTGLSVRTIRYYVAEGLIPSSGMEGPGTRYRAATLARLRLIAKLKDAHQPLAEIRKRLRAMSDQEVQEAVTSGGPGGTGEAERGDSALDYIRLVLNEGKHQPDAAPAEPTPAKVTAMSPPPPDPLEPFERSRWEHVVITPDIEIHIRRPLSRRDIKMVERLLAFAKQLQGEDAP